MSRSNEPTELRTDRGSFSDPSGTVFHSGTRVLRTVNPRAVDDYEFARDSGYLARAIGRGWLIESQEVDRGILDRNGIAASYLLEHPRLPFVSYPYEWTFSALRDAALLHLDLHLDALRHGLTLSDASAFNVQFRGGAPIFIDVLSLRRYRPQEFWIGHRQFCEQFLNPLLLQSLLGVPFQPWYRGALDGIPTPALARLLPLRSKLRWRVFAHVVLPARYQERPGTKAAAQGAGAKGLALPAFLGLLRQLRKWISALQPAVAGSRWANYYQTCTYSSEDEARKRDFVREFAAATRPVQLWDFGCHDGRYAEIALNAGAGMALGFDTDPVALECAYRLATERKLNLLPLYLDASNPTPDQGWDQAQRAGLAERRSADAVLALAFIHHLAIRHNLGLDRSIAWVVRSAPRGVIEFVPKNDPTVQTMLTLREDIFDDYDEASFQRSLLSHASIVKSAKISASGRTLYWYERRGV